MFVTFAASLTRFAGLAGVFMALVAGPARAQERLNDKDLESLMRNLRDDAKSFRPVFESALKKSTIRKTSQEKDAKNLAALFAKQTDSMLNGFKETKKANDQLPSVLSNAQQIDRLITRLRLSGQVTSSWDKIQTELQQVANAFGMSQQYSRAEDVPGPATSQAGSTPCEAAVGVERSKRLVEECLSVSPATHPPCNVQNSCVLIIDEIKRGCSMLGRNAPGFCGEYK